MVHRRWRKDIDISLKIFSFFKGRVSQVSHSFMGPVGHNIWSFCLSIVLLVDELHEACLHHF